MKTKVINLFGGPGCGKSTTAAKLFGLMKSKNESVELVQEYAKELTWKEDWSTLGNQLLVSGVQLDRLNSLEGKVEYIITDSPLLLGCIYCSPLISNSLKDVLLEEFSYFNNINFFINRTKEYNTNGRSQTYEEALIIDKQIHGILQDSKVDFTKFDDWSGIAEGIYKYVKTC